MRSASIKVLFLFNNQKIWKLIRNIYLCKNKSGSCSEGKSIFHNSIFYQAFLKPVNHSPLISENWKKKKKTKLAYVWWITDYNVSQYETKLIFIPNIFKPNCRKCMNIIIVWSVNTGDRALAVLISISKTRLFLACDERCLWFAFIMTKCFYFEWRLLYQWPLISLKT